MASRGKPSSNVRSFAHGLLSLPEIATDTEVNRYLERWTSGKFWELPGFRLIHVPNAGALGPFLGSDGQRARYALPVSTPRRREKIMLNSLLMLFQAMLAQRSYYHVAETRFYGLVNADLKLGSGNCKSYADMYVAGRRSYLYMTHQSLHFSSTITDLVDRWIFFLDHGAPLQLKTADPEATSGEHAVKYSNHIQYSSNGTGLSTSVTDDAPNCRKRSRSGHERWDRKRCKTDDHGTLRDSNGGLSEIQTRSPSQDTTLVKADPEVAAHATNIKRSSSVQSISTTSSPAQRSMERISNPNEPAASAAAMDKLRNLTEKRHDRYKLKHNKLKARSSAQNEAIADLRAALGSNTSTVNQLSKDLEEQREILRFVQTSCGSLVNRLSQKGDILQTLMDKTRSVASDQVKLTWQGAALQVAQAKRDVERLVQVQGQRIDTINTKIDSQISSIAALNTKVASHRSSIQKQEIRGGSQDLMISQLAKDMGETVQRTEELDRQQTRQQTSSVKRWTYSASLLLPRPRQSTSRANAWPR